ncbi:hypothetical protein [Candidatus Avelusimicrobium gallicola]|uniref:Uncharacterized protein n=1 Tax=Candidatus Avelusimicrobium gallicola TaxID=2562704 RepID=A0A1Y4DKY9_9BACT|nr:hypothetical protein [Elusimicrobium sp. An273]OUO56960.1 hypothetical protein B5F75_03695 [Elusimicrobium sp. An273]
MRKIKRFKIASRQREILRKLLRELPLLRRAGFTSEAEVTAFILAIFKLLDPGVVYEFNQDAHWELDDQNVLYKEMFSACAVTLGGQLEPFLNNITNEDRKTAAMIVILEFLRSAVTFVAELVKEQAQKEECETLDLQFVYLPPFGAAAAPKLLREAVRLEPVLAQKALPVILQNLNAEKIDLSVTADGELTPRISTVFLVPWQKSRKKGKK